MPSDGVMVALFPDRTVAEALALPDGLPPEELHVTLAFLGPRDDLDPDMLAALPHIVRQFAAFRNVIEGEVGGVGRFTAADPQAFFAVPDVPGLSELRGELVDVLRANEIEVADEHGFNPHITLAYLAADDPDPIETVTAHRLRFTELWLAAGDERRAFPLFDPDEFEAGALSGPIVAKNARQQIAYGAVLVPGEPDSDGEVLSAEKIEEVAHTWLEEFQLIDRQHALKAIDASPVESYITPDDQVVTVDGRSVTLPAGSWIMAAKVRDDAIWREIEAGTRTGFSVMGVPRDKLAAATAALKAGEEFPFKRVTLADVGGGDPNGPWVAPFVSIVDMPAVPKAKFFALKDAPANEKTANLLDRILDRVSRMVSGNPATPALSSAAEKQLAEYPELRGLLHPEQR